MPASLVVAIAASVSAAGCDCGTGYVDQCVDSMGRMLPEAACRQGGTYYSGAHWIHVERSGFGGSGGGGGGSFSGGFGG